LHLDDDLSGPKTGKNGRHPLPDVKTFAAKMSEIGVDSTKQVIAYDDIGGAFATRLWWMLRWLGHPQVALLDGGFSKWMAEKQPIESNVPVFQPAKFVPILATSMAVDMHDVSKSLESPSMKLVDARSPDRFEGKNETIDPVAGHIPGAQNRFFKLNLN